MTTPLPMLALTGGIAAGKSYVATRWHTLRGWHIIDADQLARDIVAPGQPLLDELVARFGAHILDASGALQRPVLRDTALGEPGGMDALNALMHPAIRALRAHLMDEHARRHPHTVLMNAIPLLVETNQVAAYAGIVVVQASEPVRIERLMRERGMAEETARAIVARQVSEAERARVGTWLVSNEGDLPSVDARVDALGVEIEAWWAERLG